MQDRKHIFKKSVGKVKEFNVYFSKEMFFSFSSLSHLFFCFSPKENAFLLSLRRKRREMKRKEKRKCHGAMWSVGNENKHNSCLGQLIKTVFCSL